MALLTDLGTLRGLLFAPLIDGTHLDISGRFIKLGIVETDDDATTKTDRVRAVLANLGDDELVRVAKQVLNSDSSELLLSGVPPRELRLREFAP